MRKTMVYLEEEQFRELKQRARREGRSMAALIREAVRRYLQQDGGRASPDYFAFVGIAAGPRGEATSERAEEVLRELLRRGREQGAEP